MSAFQRAARTLLSGQPGEGTTSKHIAERAAQSLERLAKHLTRLLGEMGVNMLLERSIAVAASQFPWLRVSPSSAEQPQSPTSALGHAMEKQEPGVISDAFVEVLSIFVGLLKRLIGDGLVDALLNEVWPATFVPAVKDTP
jgi:hypothetical protein